MSRNWVCAADPLHLAFALLRVARGGLREADCSVGRRGGARTGVIDAAIGMMAGVLRPLAAALTTLPAGPAHQHRTAGFSFEVYYVLGNMVPWREPAWALRHERMAFLTQRCAEATDIYGAPGAVREAHQRAVSLAAALAAHVPAGLLPSGVALGAGARD
jgi:hypothetical protein